VPTIRNSYNVTSITDVNKGKYVVNMNPLPHSGYACFCFAGGVVNNTAWPTNGYNGGDTGVKFLNTNTAFPIVVHTSSAVWDDFEQVSAAAFL
jgi:hypothetical protein